MFTHYSLDTLLGHSLTAIGRAADLVWWIFDVTARNIRCTRNAPSASCTTVKPC